MSDALPGHTLDEVWDSFGDLKDSYESGSMAPCANYVQIRLVAIIEQFCRVTYKRRKLKYDWKQNPPRIAIQILVDIFQRFDPDIKRNECENAIWEYVDRGDRNMDAGIHLKSDVEVRGLVKNVLKKQNSDAAEWIRLYMLSFQSLKSIRDKLGVGLPPKMAMQCNELFGMRHAATHTLSDHQVNNTTFDVVERLLHLIDSWDD